MRWVLRVAALLFAFAALVPAFAAGASEDQVRTAWRLLDYVAVDYPEAVQDGRVVNQAEYEEMLEFTSTVSRHLRELPRKPEAGRLITQSDALSAAVRSKASPATIERAARTLGEALLAAYPVPMAPASAPDLARGAKLYQEHCSSCHGVNGGGDGPQAGQLDPPPIVFTDKERANQRSVFSLYQVITQGLEGTSMESFSELPSDDRWALAGHVSRLSFTPEERAAGERLWRTNPALRASIANLEDLVAATPKALAAQAGGTAEARQLLAYLRTDPSVLVSEREGSLALTRQRLAESVSAYEAGDANRARELALSAYLDGFEPLEPTLASRDGELMREIEAGMAELRQRIGDGRPAPEVAEQARSLDNLFAQAEQVLRAEAGTDLSTFVSSFTILLREGLEALLIVVAMVAFLRKADRAKLLAYVHAGWVAALVAGAATWFVATTLISISGAGRELTEGFGALLAAGVLVSVGIWMHGKSRADVWQRYIKDKLDHALSRRSAWFLFALSFVVVYREVFETILFFAALSTPEHADAALGGAIAGAVILAVIAWAMLRYARRLPITQFFRVSSLLIAVLAVVLTGKGVAALQEAGTLGISRVSWAPQIDLLGIYPSLEGLLAQVAVALVLMLGFSVNRDKPAIEGAA